LRDLSELSNGVASVDHEGVAGDERREVAEEERDGAGDLVGLTESAEWDARPQLVGPVTAVFTNVGATALTRIPCGAHSRASCFVR
jgi:hypothetical protein